MAFKIISNKFLPILRTMHQIPLKTVKNYSTEMSTLIYRQNFSPRTEHQLNIQIGQELDASHSYLAMANFFSRTEISLNGSAGFFLTSSSEERRHALDLMKYQNMRGGRALMYTIMKPKEEFDCLMNAIEHAILLERQNTKALMEVVKVAEKEHDVITVDFIVTKFLNEQMESLKTLGTIFTRLKKFEEPGLGEYMIDLELQKKFPISN